MQSDKCNQETERRFGLMEIMKTGFGILKSSNIVKTKRKCIMCDRLLDNDMSYCPYCGAQLIRKQEIHKSRWKASDGEEMLAESGISVSGGYFRENESMKIEAYGSKIHFSAFGHWTRHFNIFDGCIIKEFASYVSLVFWSIDDKEWQDIRLKKDEHSRVVVEYVSDFMKKKGYRNTIGISKCRFDKRV